MLDGRYFYADFCTGLVRSFAWTGGVRPRSLGLEARRSIAQGVLPQISSFGVDADGEVYIVALPGTIFELVPAK